jgi:hypothetical protein
MSEETTRVITREQQAVKVIEDKETIDLLFEENYEPIIIVLREGPLTIKELVQKYNEIAKEPKSEMTVYRYVKELSKCDIVVEVGKIITRGQSATETLYGRTAKIFWNLKDKGDYWLQPKMEKTLDALRQLLVLYKENTNISLENLATLLGKTSNKSSHELASFFEANNDKINEIIAGFSFKQVDSLFDLLGTLILLIHSKDFEDELEQCGC